MLGTSSIIEAPQSGGIVVNYCKYFNCFTDFRVIRIELSLRIVKKGCSDPRFSPSLRSWLGGPQMFLNSIDHPKSPSRFLSVVGNE